MDEKYIVKGLEQIDKLPTKSLGDVIFSQLLKCPDQKAMVDVTTGKMIYYQDLFKQTCKLAIALKKLGVKQNDVVSICSENNVHFFLPIFAGFHIGAIAAPMNFMYTTGELKHLLLITKPKIVFCSASCLDKFIEIKKETSFIETIILLGDSKNGIQSIENLISNFEVKNFHPLRNVDIDNQVAVVLYSSGTTGLPKAVMLTHKNILASLMYTRDPRLHDLDSTKSINILPFFHVYGLLVALDALMNSKMLIFFSKFDSQLYLESIHKYKVSTLLIVPPIAVFFQKGPSIDKYDFSSVKEIYCGGAPLKKEIEKAIKERLNVNTLRQGFGLTETTAAGTVMPLHEYNHPGSVGKVVPHMVAKVIDPETGKSLGPGEHGEICFKGPTLMKGYFGNAVATSEAIDKDGWLRTGDVGYYDEDGYFFIIDRLKELIKYKGFQVAPAELERALLEHPNIADAGVIGIPDDEAGELPLAFVIKQSNVKLTANEVQEFIKKQVSPHKYLRGGVIFVKEIPKTSSGKIMRRKLRELITLQKSKL